MSRRTDCASARAIGWGLAWFACLVLAATPAVAGGVLDKKFTRSKDAAAAAALDLHVRFNTVIDSVEVVTANGNPLTPPNPGPFGLPPEGLGTSELTFKGGSPGSVAPGATAPSQPAAGTHRYRFRGQAKTVSIKQWWWTDGAGQRLPMFEDDCLGAGRFLGGGERLCVESASERCTAGAQAAATLLLPYFEVDLADPDGLTTLVAVSNASPEVALVRAVLWTDAAVPTLSFNLLLSPSDVQTINLRDVFVGNLPDTTSVFDGVHPPACDTAHFAPALSEQEVLSLRADHTGKPNPMWGRCGGFDHGDEVARGYLTLDHLSQCIQLTREDTWQLPPAGFHMFGSPLDRGNVLWGDYFIVTSRENFARGERLVHVPWDGARTGDTAQTFYGSYLGFDGRDGRLPLPSAFSGRFIDGGPLDGGTDFLIWRDTRSGAFERFDCGTLPSWAPLGSPPVEVFDEAENSHTLPGGLDQLCLGGALPAAFRCHAVIPAALGTIAGFVSFDLWHAPPNEAPVPAQGWVSLGMSAEGRFDIGFHTVPVDDGCELPRAVPLPVP